MANKLLRVGGHTSQGTINRFGDSLKEVALAPPPLRGANDGSVPRGGAHVGAIEIDELRRVVVPSGVRVPVGGDFSVGRAIKSLSDGVSGNDRPLRSVPGGLAPDKGRTADTRSGARRARPC